MIEQPATANGSSSSRLERRRRARSTGSSLPTVTINGTTAQELDTALGTVVRFTRSGVTYTVLGSVTPSVADAAARGL